MADPSDFPGFPPGFFERLDESDDERFYAQPRLVTHIDDATIEVLTGLYREQLPAGAHVLDLMSSWVSHLPPEVGYPRVAGLGMNRPELEANPRLHDFEVHNLNREPELPFGEAEFDAVLCAVSIQYLTRPVEVLSSVRRVLRPGGGFLIGISRRDVCGEGGVRVAVAIDGGPRAPRGVVFRVGGWVGRAGGPRSIARGRGPAPRDHHAPVVVARCARRGLAGTPARRRGARRRTPAHRCAGARARVGGRRTS